MLYSIIIFFFVLFLIQVNFIIKDNEEGGTIKEDKLIKVKTAKAKTKAKGKSATKSTKTKAKKSTTKAAKKPKK